MNTRNCAVRWSRRDLLAVACGGVLTACSPATQQSRTASTSATPTTAMSPTASTSGSSAPLIVYFSRAGENYYNGGRRNLTVGNTQVLAGHLADLLGCPSHRLQEVDTYPTSYDETVARNSREQDERARPQIANPLTSLEGYDTVLIGSPIWNVQAPRIMRTFIDTNDFSGITVAPFVTHAMSGMGNVPDEYREACRGAARITQGCAVRGEEASGARDRARSWLLDIGLL